MAGENRSEQSAWTTMQGGQADESPVGRGPTTKRRPMCGRSAHLPSQEEGERAAPPEPALCERTSGGREV